MPTALITSENARELAYKSVESRRAAKQRAKEAEQAAQILAKRLAEQLPVNEPVSDKQRKVEVQLASIDRLLDASKDYKEINALTQAKERLLNAWALLTGFPRPGVRKQSKTRQTLSDVSPLGLSSASDTPSPSVQQSPSQPSTPQSTQSPDWHQFTG